MAIVGPYQGLLFAAVVRCFDVVATGRPCGTFEVGTFERGTFELVPRCEFGGGFAGTPLVVPLAGP